MADGDGTPALEVVDGGLLTTIQDLGRPGHVHEGVPRSGAADGLSLAVANALAANPAGAAALEITVGGLRMRALRSLTLGFGGADLGAVIARVAERGQAALGLRPGLSHTLRAGEELVFEGRASDGLGCRAYLAVPGGFDVPEVLGSRSTSLVGRFGGLNGRALRAGDVLSAASSTLERAPARLPSGVSLPSPAQRVRVLLVEGDASARSAVERLTAQAWVVSGDSDRRGLRLVPAAGQGSIEPTRPRESDGWGGRSATADGPSEAVIPGTVQVTPSGQPLVLMPDAGTTGGYAIAAVVIAADLPILGQLAPWDEVRFRLADLAIAAQAARERRQVLDDVAAALAAVPRSR